VGGVRTISVRLDDASEAQLESLCQQLGLSQTDVVKAGLALLQQQRLSPAALAESLDLVGCFASGDATRGRDHADRLRQKLRRQHQAQR
jgi:Arc/MetJ-type ribon-helix-helix transcriptional regulator